MTDFIKIDENICDYYETHGDIELNPTKFDWCVENDCPCENIPFDECLVKAIEYCKLKDKQLQDADNKIKELERKLNIAIETLESYSELYVDTEFCEDQYFGSFARDALIEIGDCGGNND